MRVFFGIVMVLALAMWVLDTLPMAWTWDAQHAAWRAAQAAKDADKDKALEALRLARMESRAVWDSMGFATLILVTSAIGFVVSGKKT